MHYGLGTVALTSTGCYQIRDEGKKEGMTDLERKNFKNITPVSDNRCK